MLARLKRFDRLIAEGEARIAEQSALITRIESEGGDATMTRQALKTFEGIVVEYRRARNVTEELRQRINEARRKLGYIPTSHSHH